MMRCNRVFVMSKVDFKINVLFPSWPQTINFRPHKYYLSKVNINQQQKLLIIIIFFTECIIIIFLNIIISIMNQKVVFVK